MQDDFAAGPMTEAGVSCKPVAHIYDEIPRAGVVFSMEPPRAHTSCTITKLAHGHALGLGLEQTTLLHECHARLADGAVRQWRGSEVRAPGIAKSLLVLANSESQGMFGAGMSTPPRKVTSAFTTGEVEGARVLGAGAPQYDPYPLPLASQALATFHAAWQAHGTSKHHQLEAVFKYSTRTHAPSLQAATSGLFLVGNGPAGVSGGSSAGGTKSDASLHMAGCGV